MTRAWKVAPELSVVAGIAALISLFSAQWTALAWVGGAFIALEVAAYAIWWRRNVARCALLDIAVQQVLDEGAVRGEIGFDPAQAFERFQALALRRGGGVGVGDDDLGGDDVRQLRQWLERAAEMARAEGAVPSMTRPGLMLRAREPRASNPPQQPGQSNSRFDHRDANWSADGDRAPSDSWRRLLGYPLWFLTFAAFGVLSLVGRDYLTWWAFVALVPLALWLKERMFPSPPSVRSRARELRDFAVMGCDFAYVGASIVLFWNHFQEWWAVPLGLVVSMIASWGITPSGYHAEVRAKLVDARRPRATVSARRVAGDLLSAAFRAEAEPSDDAELCRRLRMTVSQLRAELAVVRYFACQMVVLSMLKSRDEKDSVMDALAEACEEATRSGVLVALDRDAVLERCTQYHASLANEDLRHWDRGVARTLCEVVVKQRDPALFLTASLAFLNQSRAAGEVISEVQATCVIVRE